MAYAKASGIAPGVSLSAAQMALVTTDMVLLTTQTVALAVAQQGRPEWRRRAR